ncbi:hypothetical protein KIN20_014355 [Parelaphostrongylus tenuis]|uniref:Uncharacterized protein n=1 Tax=Parelaphostrongylus tenuis TaxID=148309 RepID=A0AAD5QRT0_PARTN|nr:hypothetical protein KIN20_014355 [Parelaphostrongylus tenuis]
MAVSAWLNYSAHFSHSYVPEKPEEQPGHCGEFVDFIYKRFDGHTQKMRYKRNAEVDLKAVIEATEDDSPSPTVKLVDDFDRVHARISSTLKAVGKKWKKCRWISHDLT